MVFFVDHYFVSIVIFHGIASILFVLVFAWEAYERGADVHLQSDPTKLELLHKTYEVKKEGFKKEVKGGILEKVSEICLS